MRRSPPSSLPFLLLGLLACRQGDPADMVLRHGAVYPLARDSASAEALAVRDGRIVFVGSDREVEAYIGRGTVVLDARGGMVLPGFRDTHAHPRGGIQLGECTLDGLRTRQEVLDSVRRYSAAHPEAPWIRGSGWQLPVFPEANPRKEWLDEVVPDRPVYLRAADGHSAWVNSRALGLAGITRETRDPPNGRIERDSRGEPTGTLRESAMELVTRILPPRTDEEVRTGLLRAVAMANQLGITALYDASAGPEMLEGFAGLDSAGLLTARVVAAIAVDPEGGLAQVDSLRAWRGRHRGGGGRYFSPRAAKLFVDGVIEAKTAALLAPYVGDDSRGEPNFAPARLDTLVAALDAAGFQIHAHAIGDRAVRMTLDALAFARRLNGPRDARPIISHLELIDSVDVPRFAELGVIPSFQPLWAYRDEYITRLTEPVLGPERSRWLYPIGAVVRTGAHLAVGSDWPVTSMNPLEAIQVAVTRRGLSEPAGPAWLPEHAVDLATILEAYTLGGAYATGEEASAGTLEIGKAADFIVLDRDLYRIPVTEIHRARVLLTVLDGREVWRADRAETRVQRP